MSSLWIVRIITLMALQLVTSFLLIYHKKNKLSYFTEALLCIASIFCGKAFSFELIILHSLEYIAVKALLVIIVRAIKLHSFSFLAEAYKNERKGKKVNFKSPSVKRRLRFASHMWHKVDYGIRIKKVCPLE